MNQLLINPSNDPIICAIHCQDDIPSPETSMAAPKQEGQKDHEKRVCAEVRRERKERVQGRGANLFLQPGKVWRLISDQRDQFLSWPVAPEW